MHASLLEDWSNTVVSCFRGKSNTLRERRGGEGTVTVRRPVCAARANCDARAVLFIQLYFNENTFDFYILLFNLKIFIFCWTKSKWNISRRLFNDYLCKRFRLFKNFFFLFKKFYNWRLFERYYISLLKIQIEWQKRLFQMIEWILNYTYMIKLYLFFIESIIWARKILGIKFQE